AMPPHPKHPPGQPAVAISTEGREEDCYRSFSAVIFCCGCPNHLSEHARRYCVVRVQPQLGRTAGALDGPAGSVDAQRTSTVGAALAADLSCLVGLHSSARRPGRLAAWS